MKTNDLINALAADQLPDTSSLGRGIVGAAVIGAAISAAFFMSSLGWRPDIDTAFKTIRFPFKIVVTLAVLVTAASLLLPLARPNGDEGRSYVRLWIGPALLLAGVIVELTVLSSSSWQDALIGSNAQICLAAIPLLSVVPLVALLLILKRGAPTRPHVAGAMAGLLSAAIAATMYALHCDDDSPLFVLVWYSIGIAIVTAAAAVVGGRVLRW